MFTQNTPAYDNVPSNYIWLQKDQHFGRKSCLITQALTVTLNLKTLNKSSSTTLTDDDAAPYKLWLQKSAIEEIESR